MGYFSRRSTLSAALAITAVAAIATAWREHAEPIPEREASLTSSGAARSRPANHATRVSQHSAPPTLEVSAIPIEVGGAVIGSINATALLQRPTTLQASERRAWLLAELLHNTHIPSNAVIHALTNDGRDYIIEDSGRRGDAIVVRRNTGEIYIGWLDGDLAGRALTDAERPAERIENLSRIAFATPVVPDHLPARLTVLVDGKLRNTLTPDQFAAAATLHIHGQREGSAAAIDVAHAFGGTHHLVGLTAGGARVASPRPAPDARAVVYLTRRGQFKLAWIDPTGEPIAGTKQRDVTELALATVAPVAAR
jgi:hypothetical protein